MPRSLTGASAIGGVSAFRRLVPALSEQIADVEHKLEQISHGDGADDSDDDRYQRNQGQVHVCAFTEEDQGKDREDDEERDIDQSREDSPENLDHRGVFVH